MKKHCTDTFRVHHITKVFSSLSEHNIKFYRGPSITFITLKVFKVNSNCSHYIVSSMGEGLPFLRCVCGEQI